MDVKSVVAKILSGESVKDSLGLLSEKEKEETTTTANVGAYEVPLGAKMPYKTKTDDEEDEDE